MAKHFKILELQILLDQLSIKTGESLDHYGLGRISEEIGQSVSQRYLYYSLVKPIKSSKKNGATELRLSEDKIDCLAKYLGFDNFKKFVKTVNQPVSEVLKLLVGTYYSYVRKNAEQGILLKSPVLIEEVNSQITLTLQGPHRDYQGSVELQDGCFACLMKSADKSFYHVYQVGKAIAPKVMQGIFSGVTSGDFPIGGRCLLIKQGMEFEDLKGESMAIDNLLAAKDEESVALAAYFKSYKQNNIIVKKSIGFDLQDLLGN